jgi:1,4-dihydroxy-2-naphthoyl-CoA hydrolase
MSARRLFHPGSSARNALPRPQNAAFRHSGTRQFLDLARGACSVIDPDALPEFQVTDILLAGNGRRLCRGGNRKQSEDGQERCRSRRDPDAETRKEQDTKFGHERFPATAKGACAESIEMAAILNLRAPACGTKHGLLRPLPVENLIGTRWNDARGRTAMTPLETIQSLKMPFAELKGVTFIEADKDRVVARMLVRPDLCTISHTIHGGAVMALADSVGAAATVINLPDGAKGTTTIESKTNFIGSAKEGTIVVATATPVHRGRRTQVWQTRLETEDGKLVAIVTQTQMVL